MSDEPRPRLGRGLAALIGDTAPEAPSAVSSASGTKRIPIEFIRPSARNPRRSFDEKNLAELAASISEKGVIQPILVRASTRADDAYEIIAGERRWRAAQIAGVHELPVVIIEADDKQALELAIIENVQRSDLNAVEEAIGYEKLSNEYNYSQEALAKIIGKSRSHIANTMRLLKLPESVQDLLKTGTISAGHARALLSLDEPEAMARKIVSEGLTVRDVENLQQKNTASPKKQKNSAQKEKDADTRALERALIDVLGMKVEISHLGEAGSVTVHYSSLEQLDALCQRLKS